MDKQAYERIVGLVMKTAQGMSKSAAKWDPAPDASAMVGMPEPAWKENDPRVEISPNNPIMYRNPSSRHLMTNAGGLNMKGPAYLFPVSLPSDPNTPSPITNRDLNLYRAEQANMNANAIFGQGTAQAASAKDYLMQRGKENHQRFLEGTLWKNEPSKVPVPTNISNPEQLEYLEEAGKLQAARKQRGPVVG